MNQKVSFPRRGPEAVARREHILTEFKRSGLSAYAFARKHPLPYTTLIQWLKKPTSTRRRIAFAEVQLPTLAPEPLVLELGPHARLRLTSSSQMPLAVQLIKLLQA